MQPQYSFELPPRRHALNALALVGAVAFLGYAAFAMVSAGNFLPPTELPPGGQPTIGGGGGGVSSTLNFHDDLTTVNGWTTDTGSTGTIASDGTGMYPNSFGTNNLSWHGPIVVKDLGQSLIDFDASVDFGFQSPNDNQLGRLMIELLDDTNTAIASYLISDAWEDLPPLGGGIIHELKVGTTTIIPATTQFSPTSAAGRALRFARTGTTWKAYLGGTQQGGAITTGPGSKLRKIRVSFAQYQDFAASTMRINDVLASGTHATTGGGGGSGTGGGVGAPLQQQRNEVDKQVLQINNFITPPGGSIDLPTSGKRFLLSYTGEVWNASGCSTQIEFLVDGVALSKPSVGGGPAQGWPQTISGTQLTTVTYLTEALLAKSPATTTTNFAMQAAINDPSTSCAPTPSTLNFNTKGVFQVMEYPDVSGGGSGGGGTGPAGPTGPQGPQGPSGVGGNVQSGFAATTGPSSVNVTFSPAFTSIPKVVIQPTCAGRRTADLTYGPLTTNGMTVTIIDGALGTAVACTFNWIATDGTGGGGGGGSSQWTGASGGPISYNEGDVSIGQDLNVTGSITAGSITAGSFTGSGAGLTGITSSSFAANSIDVTKLSTSGCTTTGQVLTYNGSTWNCAAGTPGPPGPQGIQGPQGPSGGGGGGGISGAGWSLGSDKGVFAMYVGTNYLDGSPSGSGTATMKINSSGGIEMYTVPSGGNALSVIGGAILLGNNTSVVGNLDVSGAISAKNGVSIGTTSSSISVSGSSLAIDPNGSQSEVLIWDQLRVNGATNITGGLDVHASDVRVQASDGRLFANKGATVPSGQTLCLGGVCKSSWPASTFSKPIYSCPATTPTDLCGWGNCYELTTRSSCEYYYWRWTGSNWVCADQTSTSCQQITIN